MKSIFTLVFLFSAILQIYSQTFNEAAEKERIKKNGVKSQSKWKYKHGSTDGSVVLTKNFDKDGNTIEEINFKPTGEISSRLTYKYDNAGNKTEYVNIDVSGNNKLMYKQQISYDSRGGKLSELGFDGINDFKLEYKYDNNGKLSCTTKFSKPHSSNGNSESGTYMVEEKWNYTYTGNNVEITILKGGQMIKEKIVEKNDNNGNLLERTNYNPDKSVIKKHTYKYDDSNRLSEEEEYFGNKFSSKLVYRYDSKGNLAIIDKTESDGKTYTNNSFKYDTKGNLVEELWYDGDPNDYSKKTYNYDNQDNVTQIDSYYSQYKYKVLYKYVYEFF